MKSVLGGRQWVAVLAALALVALAGCGAMSDARETRSSFGVDESEYTAREAVRNGSVVAFDAARDHVPEPVVLLDAHRQSLAGRSYTLDVNVSVSRPEGTVRYQERSTIAVASDHAVYHERTVANGTGGPPVTVERYANGTHVWERRTDDGQSTVSLRTAGGRVVAPTALNRTGRTHVLQGLYRTNVTDVVRIADPPKNVDGPVYRIRAMEAASPEAAVENVSLSLTVTESGRILAYDYRRVVRNATGSLVERRVSIAYRAIDETTVERPEWTPTNQTRRANTTRTMRQVAPDDEQLRPHRPTAASSTAPPLHPATCPASAEP